MLVVVLVRVPYGGAGQGEDDEAAKICQTRGPASKENG